MKTVEVFEIRPASFCPKIEAVGCYIEKENKALFLMNAAHDYEPGKWGAPGGKLEAGERPVEGAMRELFEETSIVVDESAMNQVGSVYIRKLDFDYTFHVFRVQVDVELDVRLSDEHDDYRWVSRAEIEDLALLDGAREVYEWYKKVSR